MFITNLKNLREVTLEIARLEKEGNRPKYSSSEYDENLKKCREKRKELLNLLDKNEMIRLGLKTEEIKMAYMYYYEASSWKDSFYAAYAGTEAYDTIDSNEDEDKTCAAKVKHIIRTFSKNYSYASKR